MASIDPSPFSTSIDDLLVHFRVHCPNIRAALHQRDRLWSSHIDSLLSDERMNKQWLSERIDMEHRLREEVRLLVDRIRISESDKRDEIQMAVDKEKRSSAERVASLEMYWNMAIGRVKEETRREDEVNRKRIEELCVRVQVLESELRNKDEDLDRVLEKKRVMENGFLNRITEQGKEIGELVGRIGAAEAETNRISKENRASEEEKRILACSVETLERDNRLMEAELLRVVKEYTSIVECVKDEKCKLADKFEILERDNLALEAEVFREKSVANSKLASLEVDIKNLKKIIKHFEREEAEKDLQILQMGRVLEKHKEEEVIKNKRIIQEKRALEIQHKTLKKEKMALQTRCKILEKDHRKKASKMEAGVHMKKKYNNSESVQKVEVKALVIQNKALEKKKKTILETQSKTLGKEKRKKKDKNNESFQIIEATKALEIYNRVEEAEKEDSGLLERIMILEREKEDMEFNVLRMEVLEKEKSEAMQRIMIRKMSMEAETDEYKKKNLELADGISNLECKNQRLEAEVLRMEALLREKSEGMKRVLDGKIYMEAKKYEHEKKIMELGDGISILEGEKQRLETEIIEKNEVIKVLYKENSLFEDVQPIKHLRPTDNAGLPSNLCQNEVQKSVCVACSSEHHGSFNDSVENSEGKSEYGMTCAKAGKRKQLIRQCEEPGRKIPKRACDQLLISTGVVGDTSELVPIQQNTEMNSAGLTNESNGGDDVVACRWEFDQDLLEAFDADPELCLRAVCALYRQRTRLPDMTKTSLLPAARESKLECSDKGNLSSNDPGCRKMKEMAQKLRKTKETVVGVCRCIA